MGLLLEKGKLLKLPLYFPVGGGRLGSTKEGVYQGKTQGAARTGGGARWANTGKHGTTKFFIGDTWGERKAS